MAALTRNLCFPFTSISAKLTTVFLMGWNFAPAGNVGTDFLLLLGHFIILSCAANAMRFCYRLIGRSKHKFSRYRG